MSVFQNTLIPTTEGFLKAKDLSVNNNLFSSNGDIINISSISKEEKECVILYLSDGSNIICSLDHKLFCWDKKARKYQNNKNTSFHPRLFEVSEIINNLYLSNLVKPEVNFSIKTCKPINTKEQNLLIHPYVLGAWLGDGNSRCSTIYSADEEIINKIKSLGYIVGDSKECNSGQAKSYCVRKLLTSIKKLGLYNNKHIPAQYLLGSINQRYDLLAGLLDTDGSCDDRGMIEFINCNKKLAYNTLELVNSLGLKANVTIGRATLYGKDCGPKYRICIMSNNKLCYLNRKRIKEKFHNEKIYHRYIEKFKLLGRLPTFNISVASGDATYLLSKFFITSL